MTKHVNEPGRRHVPPADGALVVNISQPAHNTLHSRFGDNALKGWLRSHPEVAAIHHADLLAHPHTTHRSS
jgi:hypothetical protein